MTREEALARQLCEASGDDPDAEIVFRELPRTRQGYPVLPKDPDAIFKGWQAYLNYARAVLDFLRHSPEAADGA